MSYRLNPHRRLSTQICLFTSLAFMAAGCVSTGTHNKTLSELEQARELSAKQAAELEQARKLSAQQATEFETLKNKSLVQTEQMQQQVASLQQTLDQEAAQRKSAEQQAAALAREREQLAARSTELQAQLDGLEREKHQLAGELGTVHGQIADLEQKLANGNASAQDEIAKLQQQADEIEANAARIADEREQLRQEQSRLATALEQERTSKDEEIKRLTRTQEELSKSLQDEIAKGNITIQQVRDQLTINMVDRVLFDSGQAQVKPAGVKVLKQVGDVLKTVSDKQIRIEGHTDNVPISPKLQDRYKTNWELSTARATNVVRYLIDQGGVDKTHLSAVGHADTHPLVPNDTEQGRASNRRIEIILYPKTFGAVTGGSAGPAH